MQFTIIFIVIIVVFRMLFDLWNNVIQFVDDNVPLLSFLTLSVVALIAWRSRQKHVQAEREREKQKLKREEQERIRDLDTQDEPFNYTIGRHANETLALRYGIANTRLQTIPYIYYAKGGVQKRNPSRDRKKVADSKTIRLRKIKKLTKADCFVVELSDYRSRKAVAVHEKGSDYIKTFLPLDERNNEIDNAWFNRNKKLETVLKGNSAMTLKDVAKIHIEKTV